MEGWSPALSLSPLVKSGYGFSSERVNIQQVNSHVSFDDDHVDKKNKKKITDSSRIYICCLMVIGKIILVTHFLSHPRTLLAFYEHKNSNIQRESGRKEVAEETLHRKIISISWRF